MQFMDDCRTHALLLLEIAKEAPEFCERAIDLAGMWLTLANLGEQFAPADVRTTYNRTPN
jgi:hypothetical protein